MAESQRIQSAAAADAVRALITAGLVEEAAAHEAVTALTAAGLSWLPPTRPPLTP